VDPSEVADTVRRAAAGDKAAWNALVESFSRLIWSVAGSHRLGPADSAEVVQTTWLRLLENLDRITQPERLGGWLATTARRECLRLLRLRGREFSTDEDFQLDRAPARDEPSPEDAVVVVAPPYAEVAAALNMPIGSIGPTRARCLQRLRRLLVADGVIDGPGV